MMQRLSLIWPILIMVAAAAWILYALGMLTGPVVELISRAWPALFVATGLILLIGRRVRFGNLLALILSGALVAGMMSVALGRQSDELVTENQKSFVQVLEPQISTINFVINTLNTQIDVVPGADATIKADYAGSRQNEVASDFKVDGSNGVLTITETRSSIPSLEASGRGKVTLTLPVAPTLTQLTITINGTAGNITVDGTGTSITELSLRSQSGKVVLNNLPQSITALTINATGDIDLGTLPPNLANLTVNVPSGNIAFDATLTALKNIAITSGAGNINARLTEQSGLIGEIKTPGEVTVTIPATIAANIQLVGGAVDNAVYSQNDYIMNIEKVLVSRRSSEPQMNIRIEAGKATIQ